MLSSQPAATVSKLDKKQPPTPLSPPSTTPSSPAATGVPTAITKKTSSSHQQRQEQTTSPAQSASYRKRLNVNQVCDWCRYRKIRCDREAPCNSCQHSKRECIRTPPEVLLSKLSKEAEHSSSSPADSTATSSSADRAIKRSSPTDDQDGQSLSLKAKKIARSNSTAPSLFGVGVEHNNINSTCSPSPAVAVMGPLSLKSTQEGECDPASSLSSVIQADGTRSFGVGEGQSQDRLLSVFAGQEYIERMKRIELLLGSVQDNNSNNNGSTPKQHSLAVPSPVASLSVDTNDEIKKKTATAPRKNKAAGSKKVARNSDGTIIKRPHVAAGFAGQKPPPKLPHAIAEAALKKLAGKKKKRTAAASSNASTATPKPTAAPAGAPSATCTPPAIAAPADATAGAPASPVSPTSAPAQTLTAHELPTGVQPKAELPAPITLTSPKSFDIPSTLDHHHHHFAQQQLQQQKDRAQILARQQQPGPDRLNTQLQGSVFIGSISIPTIPLSNTMASYESLVVPAYTSAESSPTSSPKATPATIELPISIGSSSVAATMPVGSTMDFLVFESSSSYSPFSTSVGGEGGADFATALNMVHSGSPDHHHHQLTTPIDGSTHTHSTNNNNSQVLLPFATHPTTLMYSRHSHHFQQQQQQQSHHAQHIPQDTHLMSLSSLGVPNFSSLQMTESLESWMSSQLVVPAPPPSLDGGFLSSTDVTTTTAATVLPLAADHSHASPISPLPVSSSAFLTGGGGGGGFGQLQQPHLHQHRPPIQHQHQQSFYIPQMQDDEDDGAENVNDE
ncbi:hypothetical protein BGZ95_002333 [Linnemannia exigua]|uniref:Zn(2)-C6 fungal-type domain-containing protein n=1 Tax=Linnemannia exigua TaxID=604196 RepID=A0AAD4D5M1_9FUNG|nr:hypothetical protein BGZ95_002333 [Linnemannia exigua]